MESYVKQPVSNGNPREQALIRKWWHEQKGAKGVLVWEYCLEDRYLDAVWFPDAEPAGTERSGLRAPERFPIQGQEVVLCEAKITLNPELVGQALVYKQFAARAGALINDVVVFAEHASDSMTRAAKELNLTVDIESNA